MKEYENLLDEYEKYIKQLEGTIENSETLDELKAIYNRLKELRSAEE